MEEAIDACECVSSLLSLLWLSGREEGFEEILSRSLKAKTLGQPSKENLSAVSTCSYCPLANCLSGSSTLGEADIESCEAEK